MNRVVIITGGSGGYGLAMAKAFAGDGDKVIIVAKNPEKLARAGKECGACLSFCMDVTDYSKWTELRDRVVSEFGRVDILINNAGGGVQIVDTDLFTKEKIDETIALNLNSVIYGCNVFAPVMKAQKSGTIINISSVCARHSWAGWSVYAAAKAGVLNFSKGLYVELQPSGVRVTCLIPASASTGFQSAAGIGEVQRSLKTEDIANAALFACNLPSTAVVEEMTVWGIDQEVQPL